jgi:hypothetical protein
MFEEWISVRKAMAPGHFVEHDLHNSFFMQAFQRVRLL